MKSIRALSTAFFLPNSTFRSPLIRFSRTAPHYASGYRKFHASKKAQSSMLDTCCCQTQELIGLLHDATGLPWVAVLPLTAILIKSTIVLPIQIWTRKQAQRVATVRPLLRAWAPIMRQRVMQQGQRLPPTKLNKMVQKELVSKRVQLFKSMGIKAWAPYLSYLQFPIWLLVIETVRRMCGAGTGLLSLVVRQFEGASANGEAVPHVSGSSSSLIETSLSTEGALWFPDLLVSDPMLVLPFALSASLIANLKLHQASDRSAGIIPSTFTRRLEKIIMLLAIAIGPLTLRLPTAILVYWISSALFATAQTALFSVFMPLPRSPVPCKPKFRPYKANVVR